MTAPGQLPRGAAVALGLLFGAIGLTVVMATLSGGVGGADGDAPGWIGIAVGLVFLLLGAAIIIGYAVAGGAAPDGDLLPGTPPAVRLTQYLLGLGIVGLLAAVFGWIAFGVGPRQFRLTGLPGLGPRLEEMVGRTAFGAVAALMVAFFGALVVVRIRKLRGAGGGRRVRRGR